MKDDRQSEIHFPDLNIYTLDLYGTSVEVMIGYSTYQQNGSLAAILFYSPDKGYGTDIAPKERPAHFNRQYAVITSNDCCVRLLEGNRQFISEYLYPGIGEWLERNGIAREIKNTGLEIYEENPVYEFGFTCQPENHDRRRVIREDISVQPPRIGNAQDYDLNLQDMTDQFLKCETFHEIIAVLHGLPLPYRFELRETRLELKAKVNELEKEKFTGEAPAEVGYCALDARIAQDEITKFKEEHVLHPEERSVIHDGPFGQTICLGIPTYKDYSMNSSIVMLLSKTYAGEIVKQRFATADAYGNFSIVGPRLSVAQDGTKEFESSGYIKYTCQYTRYGSFKYICVNNKAYEVSSQYDKGVEKYIFKSLLALHPMLATLPEKSLPWNR